MSVLPAISLWRREVVRFFRQPSRIASAIATPVLLWLLVGTGLSHSFHLPGTASASYLRFFYPGTILLVVLFAAIFATISVIEDRHEGFLQGVLVAPVGRSSLVIGKLAGGGTIAWLQGVVLLALAPFAGIHLNWLGTIEAAGILALIALAMTGLGFGFAWKVDSTQGYHGVMNLVMFPLWLLSGALFPAAGAPGWLAWVMRLNPLTYGLAALRHALFSPLSGRQAPGSPSYCVAILVTAVVCLALTAGDLWLVRGTAG